MFARQHARTGWCARMLAAVRVRYHSSSRAQVCCSENQLLKSRYRRAEVKTASEVVCGAA